MFGPEDFEGFERGSWGGDYSIPEKSEDEGASKTGGYEVPPKENKDLTRMAAEAEQDVEVFVQQVTTADQAPLPPDRYRELRKTIRRLIESGDPAYEAKGRIYASQLDKFLVNHPKIKSKYDTNPLSDVTTDLSGNETTRMDAKKYETKRLDK